MYIAQSKRRENIAEYILYLWQLEDLLRALQFSPEAIYSQLVKPQRLTPDKEQELLIWYMDLVNLLREEGKERQGHLEHTHGRSTGGDRNGTQDVCLRPPQSPGEFRLH